MPINPHPPARITLAALLAFALLVLPARLLAHPMGNFSISHYACITVDDGFIEVRYLLDMAEIPTFQELQQTGLTARTDDPRLAAYLAAKAGEFSRGLRVTVNGRPLEFRVVSQNVIFPPGAGNLPTMKFGFLYRAELPQDCAACIVEYDDANFPERAGWKEIVALPAPGVRLVSSTAPPSDRSAALSNYPTDLLNSPPQDLHAEIVFAFDAAKRSSLGSAAASSGSAAPTQQRAKASSSALPAPAQQAPAAGPSVSSQPQATGSPALDLQPNRQATPRSAFTELIRMKEISFNVAWLAALIAVGLGALHALEPGHGKTIVAAYLVGAKGTARHAVFLGTIVTLAHTAGVYLLGGVTLYAQKYIVPDQLYPVLGVLSGLIIAVMGFYLFLKRYAGRIVHGHTHSHGPFTLPHSHGPSGHSHLHDHEHLNNAHDLAHQHAHPGAPPPNEKPSIAQLLVLGITGGIVPCPAALVVLLSAVALHRVAFGLFLIVAFSLGLAGVLIAMGLAAVYARRLMSRVPTDGVLIQRWLPLTSSAMITVLGCVITVRGLIAAGIVQIHL